MDKLKKDSKILGQTLDPFFEHMKSMKLLGDVGSTRLLNFASALEERYVQRCRCQLLGEVRELLLTNDYHKTIQAGVDVRPKDEEKCLAMVDGLSVFKLHKASISDTAFQLIQRCRQTEEITSPQATVT